MYVSEKYVNNLIDSNCSCNVASYETPAKVRPIISKRYITTDELITLANKKNESDNDKEEEKNE